MTGRQIRLKALPSRNNPQLKDGALLNDHLLEPKRRVPIDCEAESLLSILFTEGVGCLPHCMLGYTPPGQTPPRQTPLPGRHPPLDTTGYGQQADGMHPSGMHTG